MQNEMVEKVKKALVATLKLKSAKDINLDSKLKDDLGLDSMSSLTFLMALEDSITGFTVDPDNLKTEHLLNVATITEYVEQQLMSAV